MASQMTPLDVIDVQNGPLLDSDILNNTVNPYFEQGPFISAIR
jgi:hypothetical protein